MPIIIDKQRYESERERMTDKFYVLQEKFPEDDRWKKIERNFKRMAKLIQLSQSELDSTRSEFENPENLEELILHIEKDFIELGVKRNYERFNSSKNKKEKQLIGDSLLVELNTIERIYKRSISIIERKPYIDSLYTEFVFDAFTFSDNVPSRAKKKLYSLLDKSSYVDSIISLPKNHSLLNMKEPDLQTLDWFSNGYYNLSKIDSSNNIRYNDLRYPLLDVKNKNSSVFSFELERNGERWENHRYIDPSLEKASYSETFLGLWNRIKGN